MITTQIIDRELEQIGTYMATARQILELLKSHIENDDERFRTTALQLAANEARQGHSDIAREIQSLLQAAPRISSPSKDQKQATIPFGRPQGELSGLLEMVQPTTGLNHLILSSDITSRLQRVVKEQQQFNRLREHGLRPRQRLMLLGPPGCGKTMTAHALAHELGLPLFILRLDALFTKFLGETASKLRIVFDAIESHRAVFLFDEFDSIGLARGSQHDVAEMRRVLNSLLVFIEGMRGHSLIIAASNHSESLDPALFRRFDDIIEFSMPTQAEIKKVFEQRLANHPKSVINWKSVLQAASKLSFAEAVRAADDAMKERLIEHKDSVTTALLLKAIQERPKKTQRNKRVSYAGQRNKKTPPSR